MRRARLLHVARSCSSQSLSQNWRVSRPAAVWRGIYLYLYLYLCIYIDIYANLASDGCIPRGGWSKSKSYSMGLLYVNTSFAFQAGTLIPVFDSLRLQCCEVSPCAGTRGRQHTSTVTHAKVLQLASQKPSLQGQRARRCRRIRSFSSHNMRRLEHPLHQQHQHEEPT